LIHLDTSFLVDLMREVRRRTRGPATRLLEELPDPSFGVSIFVLCELEAGASRAANPAAERQQVDEMIGALELSLPDRRFAATYASALESLYRRRLNVDTMDLLIGCSALVDGAVLVTRNVRHFSMIESLRLITYT
jgi:tRNA(fMet)-specific endonuclease VapC